MVFSPLKRLPPTFSGGYQQFPNDSSDTANNTQLSENSSSKVGKFLLDADWGARFRETVVFSLLPHLFMEAILSNHANLLRSDFQLVVAAAAAALLACRLLKSLLGGHIDC